jgi:pyruvate,water dikinase
MARADDDERVSEPAGPLHMRSGPDVLWTTVNVSEAAPGVHTPLGWSIWGDLAEAATAASTIDLGAWPRDRQLVSPDADDRFGAVFFGRYALNVNTFRELGDRMPGSSGDAVEEQMFGAKRSGLPNRPVRRRYFVIAARLPLNLVGAPRTVRRCRVSNAAWWRAQVFGAKPASLPQALALVDEAARRFVRVMRAHLVVTMLAQGAFEQLAQVCTRAGAPGLERALVGGYGGLDEAALVADVRRLADGALSERAFLATHGYHGPAEGDVSSRSWREDPRPVRALAGRYRAIESSDGQEARVAREQAERELRDRAPAVVARGLTPLLAMTRHLVLSREIGKAGFLIAMDGLRAGARGAGTALAQRGSIDEPDDVFFLNLTELRAAPSDRRAAIAARRAAHARYCTLELPETWRGTPQATPLARSAATATEIRGLGVGGGTITGTARVLLAAEADELERFEPGEILVCHVTDPSWAPILSIAAAAVIDIGGPLSHGAIVAREFGIPCVINTKRGTAVLRTGNRIEVDGDAGTVRVDAGG